MMKRRFFKFLSVLLCFTLMLTTMSYGFLAEAADSGCIFVAPGGSDDTGSGTIDSPYASLAKAVSVVSSGQTIYLRDGSYSSGSTLEISGKSNITIRNYGSENATVNYEILVDKSSNHIAFTGFSMETSGTAIECAEADTVSISNMDITGRVYIYDSRNITVNENRLHGNTADMAVTIYYGKYVQIYNNLIYNNTQSGIYALESTLQCAIYNNTFYGNAQGDILINKNPSTLMIKNNIFQKGFVIYGDISWLTKNTVDNNFYDTDAKGNVATFVDTSDESSAGYTFAEFQALGGSPEKAGKIGNPLFADVDNADFHILSGSPCINCAAKDIGTSNGTAVTAPAVDYYEETREFPDIGAAEYISNVPAGLIPGSISFTDQDTESGKIAGTILWTAAPDESTITAYGVFYVLSDGSTQQIGEDVAKGSTYQLVLPMGTAFPSNALKLEVVAKTADGFAEKGTSIALLDNARPQATAQNVSFVDNDLDKGEISGNITWVKAADESEIKSYEVYFVTAADDKISQIGSDVTVGGTYSISVPENTALPAGAVKIAVYSKNDAGLSPTAATFILFDTSSTEVYVSPDGNDANDGSIDHPLATINRAASVMPDGSTIYLRAGVYNEAAVIRNKNNLTIEPKQGETAVVTQKMLIQYCDGITVKNVGYKPSDNKLVLQADQCKNTIFDGLSVAGCVEFSASDGYTLQNSIVHDSAEEGGVTLYNSKNGKVFSNIIYNSQKQGIYLLGSGTTNNLIAHNTVYNSTKADILINSLAAYGTASGNTFYNNIFTKEFSIGSDAGITGNTFDYNLYNTADGNVLLINSVRYTFSQFQSYASGSRETHGVTGNADFYNAAGADFRLNAGSAAIDCGLADSSLPQTDIAGCARNGDPDIGAYEYDDSINTSLQILSKSPDGLKEGTDSTITVQLSDTLSGTQPDDCIAVQDSYGNQVPGAVTVNGKTLTFTPSSELDYNTLYTVTVKSSVVNSSGDKTLGKGVSWTFKTKSASATGHTYYLSPDGKDDNPGTIEAPMRDITTVSAMLQPGDTLIMRGGTYDGVMLIWGKGSPDSDPITVKNYDGETVRIINTTQRGRPYVMYVGASYNVRVSGLISTNDGSVVDGSETANCGMYVHQSQNVTIDHCTFYDGTAGMVIRDGCSNITVYSNIFHDEDWRYGGMTLYNEDDQGYSGVTNCHVYNNIFYKDYYGILFYGGTVNNNYFYNNTFYGNTLDLSSTTNSGVVSNNTFKNNIFSSEFESYNNFIGNNHFNNNLYNSDTLKSGEISAGVTLDAFKQTGQEANGVSGSAKFSDPSSGEFTLANGSYAIAIGCNDFSLATDFDGTPRNSVIDAGAYKYTGGTKIYVSPSGSDDADGTAANPYRTIGKAVYMSNENDTILVKAGTYPENLTVSGKNKITVKAFGDGTALLTGTFSVLNSSDITIKGMQWIPSGNASFTGTDVQNLIITGMTLGGNVVLKGAAAFDINGSILKGSSVGLTLNGSTDGRIVNNQFIHHSGSAIQFADGTNTGISVANNTFYGNSTDISMAADNQTANTFKNNIFSSGLELASQNDVSANTWNYNCYADTLNTVAKIGGSAYTLAQMQQLNAEAKGFMGNPQFADPTSDDYRITYYSDCRGAGTSVGAPLTDYSGVTRKKPADIGAFEYSGVTKTYYVSSEAGSDSNPGTGNLPFKTIQCALGKIRPMETLYIHGGTYNEALNIADLAGSSYGYLNIKAFQGESVVIDGGGTLSTGLTVSNASYVRISGITIQNFTISEVMLLNSQYVSMQDMVLTGGSAASLDAEDSQNCSITGSTIQNDENAIGSSGIKLSGGNAFTVSQTEISGEKGSAVSSDGTGNLVVVSNILTENGSGISVKNAVDAVIYNNTFYGNIACDLNLDEGATGANVRNNIFGSEKVTASCLLTGTGNTLDYNHYAEPDKAAATSSGVLTLEQVQAAGQEAHATSGDPCFYNAAEHDFDLQKGSACIGSGLSDSKAPATDFSGNAFMQPIDKGAHFSPLSFRSYYVSPDGDDNNDGSINHPWKTIGKGMQYIKPSDTLYIRGGNYNERVNIDQKKGITFRGQQLWYTVENYPGETVTFNSGDSRDVAIKFTKSSYWVLKGLQFTAYTGAAVWVTDSSSYVVMDGLTIWDISNPNFIQDGVEGILGDSSYCTVRNCVIHDIGQERMSMADHGIYVGYGANHWLIDSNTIYNVPGGAIQFYGQPDGGNDSVVTNNLLYNSMTGITITRTARAVISNNTFYNNWYNDIYMDYNLTDTVIENNIFYNDLPTDYQARVQDLENHSTKLISISPAVFGIYSSEVAGNTFRNNVYYYKNFQPTVRCLTPEGVNGQFIDINSYFAQNTENTFQNNFQANPLFTNTSALDFSITPYSPLVNAGYADGAPAKDFTGTARIGIPDIGAYECVAQLNTASLSCTADKLKEGKTAKLKLSGMLSDGQSADIGKTKIQYVISNPGVISAENGVVTAKSEGTATVYALVSLGNLTVQTNSITITVTAEAGDNGGSHPSPAAVRNSDLDITADLTEAALPDSIASVSLQASIIQTDDSIFKEIGHILSSATQLGAASNVVVYDLKLLDQDGNPIENVSGKIKVKVPIPSGMSGNMHVYWYNDETHTLTDMGAAREDGYLVFETNHFSYYVIAQLAASAPSGSDETGTVVKNPETGDSGIPRLPFLMGGIAVLGTGIMIKAKKKFRCFIK